MSMLQGMKMIQRITFSMLRSAETLACRSRAFASFSVTVLLSSIVVWLMVVIVFLILSGDWTILEFVREIASERLSISPFKTSWIIVSEGDSNGIVV